MHAIIAKTAAFVATKGPQMEIIIKAKQKTKEHQFGFLDFDHALRPYYDHVLSMIKKGRYHFVGKNFIIAFLGRINRQILFLEEEPEESDDEDGGDYLHPSLMISATAASKQQEPSVEQQQKVRFIWIFILDKKIDNFF